MMQVTRLRSFVITVVLGALVIIMLREPSFCEGVRDTIQLGSLQSYVGLMQKQVKGNTIVLVFLSRS